MNIKLINFDNKNNMHTKDFLNLHLLKQLIRQGKIDKMYFIFELVFIELSEQITNPDIKEFLKRDIADALEAGFSDPIEISP